MARIETYKKRYRHPDTTGIRPLSHSDMDALNAQYKAMGSFADTAGLIASKVGQKIYRADAKAQTIKGIAEINKQMDAEFDSYDTRKDHETYKETFDKTIKGFDEVKNNTTNSIAKKNIENYITANKPGWERARDQAILGRMRINLLDDRDEILDSIKNIDLADESGFGKAEAETKIAEATDLMREHGGFSEKAVTNWQESAGKIVNNQEIYQRAQKISAADGYEEAVKFVTVQSIDEDSKEKIVNVIKSEAAQRQLQYDTYLQQTEKQFETRYDQQQLTAAEVMDSNLPEDRKSTWTRLIDAQIEERLNGQIETDFETYDWLAGLIDDYEAGKVDKEVIQEQLSKAAGKDIPTSIERQLRGRLAVIDNPDDPMNRDDVKRGFAVLDGLEKTQLQTVDDFADQRRIRLEGLRRRNEFESWVRSQENLTAKDLEEKIASMSKARVEKVVLNWFEKMFTPKEDTPFFGTTEEKLLVDKKVHKLKKLGHWKDFTTDEQQTVTEAFRRGRTVQDVLDLIE